MILMNKFSEINTKIFQKINIFSLILIILAFSIDRFSKIKVIEKLSENIYYVNEYINFNLVWNTGIGFGFLSSSSNIFYNSITFAIGLLIIFLVYLIIKSEFIDRILFSLIVGGALGNFYDRIAYAAVPDFIDFHYQNFHWFTFNIADIFISIGIIMLIIKDILIKK